MYLFKESHLRLEVNGLQTSTLKLHHRLESFTVLCLQPSKHTAPYREREKHIVNGWGGSCTQQTVIVLVSVTDFLHVLKGISKNLFEVVYFQN